MVDVKYLIFNILSHTTHMSCYLKVILHVNSDILFTVIRLDIIKTCILNSVHAVFSTGNLEFWVFFLISPDKLLFHNKTVYICMYV